MWALQVVCASVSSSDDLFIDWFSEAIWEGQRDFGDDVTHFFLWQPGEPQELLFSEWILYTSIFPFSLKHKLYFIDSNVNTFRHFNIAKNEIHLTIHGMMDSIYLFLVVHKLMMQFTVDALLDFMNYQIFSLGSKALQIRFGTT